MMTVIVKPTWGCNASCAYCGTTAARGRQGIMTDLVLEALFRRIDEFLGQRPRERLALLWHGGEPLLAGPALFERALALQQTICADTAARIVHRLQTNLTLFSRAFADVFRRLGIDGIGTSYDPVAGLRGLGRQRDDAAYRRRFRAGLDLLRAERFGWGLIHVVTRPALDRPEEIYADLAGLSARGNIRFQPVHAGPDREGGIGITPIEFADFLGAILPRWLADRDRHPMVEPFRSLAMGGARPPLSCEDSGTCADSHLCVDPEGRLSQCGRAADRGLLGQGTLAETPFAEALAAPARAEIRRRTALAMGECHGCRFWPVCHGGCPLEALTATGSLLHRSPWCEARQRFMERYFEPLTGRRDHGGTMSILIRHGDKYYEIPDEMLARSGLTKTEFEARLRGMESDLADKGATPSQCNFLNLSDTTVDEV